MLDSSGHVVHWFDGFAHDDFGRRESLARYTERELRFARSKLNLDALPLRNNPLILPDLKQSRGIRVFVQLLDKRMTAYQAPVVEVVPLETEDWKVLEWPQAERTVEAATLSKWLSQVYPPGVMERTDPQSKMAFRIKEVSGTLSLIPAGSDGALRYAVLSGNVRLTDEGSDGFHYDGELQVVLTYASDERSVHSLRGVLEATYPRYDRAADRNFRIPLQAAFESRPE